MFAHVLTPNRSVCELLCRAQHDCQTCIASHW